MLKDIVELIMAAIQTVQSIGYLDSKIGDHHYRFFESFPVQNLTPKQHFVASWTMRFTAKHSFSMNTVRQTGSFRNILMSLAKIHQSMIAYNLHGANSQKPTLCVPKMTQVAVDFLKEDIAEYVNRKFPN